MGFCGSKQTTTVETGDLSERGMTYDSLFTNMLLANMSENGWNINPIEKTEFRDPSRATTLEGRIGDLTKQLSELDAKIAANPPRQAQAGRRDPMTEQKIQLQNQLFQAQNEYNRLDKVTYTDYQIEKAPDPRVQAAIDRFGEGSPEVQQIQDQIKADEVAKAEGLANVERDYINNLQKLAKGDYSFTPEQELQLDKYIGPIKDVILNTTDDLLKKVGDDDLKLREELGKLSAEIDKTGYAVGDALKAAQIQIEENGTTLLDTLQKVNSSARNRFKFEQDLLFEQIDTQAAQQAAFMGLPPGSMAEITQKAKMKNDVLKSLELDLYQRESEGELGIRRQVGEEKRQISLARVALAESQGGKKEGVASAAFDLSSRRASKEQDIFGAKGNALLALEQLRMSKLENMALGGLPQLIGAAQGGLGFDQAMKSGALGIQGQEMLPITGQLGVEQQRQFAETTTTAKKTGGFLDVLGSIVGIGAAAASPFVGGKGGNSAGDQRMSFGSALASPIQLNYPTAQPQMSPFTLGGGFNAGYRG